MTEKDLKEAYDVISNTTVELPFNHPDDRIKYDKSINIALNAIKALQNKTEVITMKSEGVKDVVIWLKGKIKEQKRVVEKAENGYRQVKKESKFEDEKCLLDYAETNVKIERAKLNMLIDIRISTEKYMKKLRYEEEELNKN